MLADARCFGRSGRRRLKRDLWIADQYELGREIEDLAAVVRMLPSTIRVILKQYKVRLRPLPKRPSVPKGPQPQLFPRNAEITEAWAGGTSMQEIADRFGVSRQRVGQILAAQRHGEGQGK